MALEQPAQSRERSTDILLHMEAVLCEQTTISYFLREIFFLNFFENGLPSEVPTEIVCI